ncbi:hypothetical protein DEO72_LG7g1052 [Vigna unguiculata]|uniref:Uncharacterized protein n=1 Tax=Vigna unguiculata TaxID=3917 RepID=A0A4D6MIE4_VIGUN|nr:hypothetical protein DEO72_LG7g1052 [Vigna unguiculata]
MRFSWKQCGTNPIRMFQWNEIKTRDETLNVYGVARSCRNNFITNPNNKACLMEYDRKVLRTFNSDADMKLYTPYNGDAMDDLEAGNVMGLDDILLVEDDEGT